VDCLQADMRNRTGSRCVPLQDGEACDEQQQLTCSKGFCGGEQQPGLWGVGSSKLSACMRHVGVGGVDLGGGVCSRQRSEVNLCALWWG
jgi:hypothetical protein